VRLYIQKKEDFEENLKRQQLAEAEKVKEDIERKLKSLDDLIDGLENELLPAQGEIIYTLALKKIRQKTKISK
jgi:hypothetical protein